MTLSNKVISLIIFALFVLYLVPPVLAANIYTRTSYDYTLTSNPQTTYSPSLRTNETNCSVTISSYIDSFTSSGLYDITTQFYSPHGLEIGYGNRPLTQNVTCLNHGEVTTTASNESQWESKAITTMSGGDYHNTRLTTEYECGFSGDWIELSTSSYDTDSDNFVPNIYFYAECIASPVSFNFFMDSTDQDSCAGVSNDYLTYFQHYFCCGTPCSIAENENSGWWIMPFKTGASGRITYEYSAPFVFWNEEYGYYKMEDPAGTYISLSTKTGSLTLEAETEYGFYVHGTVPWGLQRTLDINISIEAYTPAWICGDWGECEYGLQHRTCEDPLNKIPDRIEYRGCIDTAYFELLLGFEEGQDPTTPYIRKCEQQYWLIGCYPGYIDIAGSIQYPKEWNVINPSYNNFLKMTSEHSTEGSRSLKMWYIPPMWAYQYPGAICNTSIYGKIPQIYKGVNDTLFVAFNITFPSEYMTIDYDVKQCQYPEVQYDGWCGKQCYGYNGNCSESAVKGEYASVLLNPNTSEIIYEFYDEAAISWETKHIDLTGSNITVGETYNLVFAVFPRDISDAYGHCVYLDNVKISIRTAELECEDNYCIGIDLYKTTRLNQTCVYEIEYNSLECLEEEDRILAREFEDYCVDTTLYTFNNDTQEWEYVIDAEYCIEEVEAQSIYDPMDLSDAEQMQAQIWTWAGYFTAPIFLALIIALAGTVYIMKSVKPTTGAGIIYTISFLGILSVESLLGIFPIWLTIILIIMSGGILAYMNTRS